MQNEYIDELTGIYNRKGMRALLTGELINTPINILFMDLDNFKTVNDLYGHNEGDKLLKAFGKIICSLGEGIYPVRLGGDEFVLVLKGNKSREQIGSLLDDIYEKIANSSSEFIGFSVISVSVGVNHNVVVTEDNLSELLRQADVALYEAKNMGKSCYIYYSDIEKDILTRSIIEKSAEGAVTEGIFELKYQPIIHMQTADIVGIDVRYMWKKEDGEYWETREYRDIFEKNGYIRRFDYYMFERACREIGEIKKAVNCQIPFNVMFSRLSFLCPSVGQDLLGVMNKYGITFDDIELSIEESAFGIRGERELIRAIEKLSEQGFHISLTKFGYNFDSIKYLPKLKVRSLRFDGYYVENNYRDSKGGQILRTLIRMGKELKLHVIGYGVDAKDKVDFLNGCGCDSVTDMNEIGMLEKDQLVDYIKGHLSEGERAYTFRFNGTLFTDDNKYEGVLKGQIEYVSGISDSYGGIRFGGGERAKNVVHLPVEVMASDSYTISLWINPESVQSFVSVFYTRYLGGFMSLMPYLGDTGISAFRIHEDINVDVWYDAICRSVEPNKWSYLTISYNAYNETMRYYINGRKSVTRRDVPALYSCRECILGGDYFQNSFRGSISGLTIWNHSKSDDEIAKLYEGFLQQKGFAGTDEGFWMD